MPTTKCRTAKSYHPHQRSRMPWTIWHLHPAIVLRLPSISKNGRKHHSVDYNSYSHVHPHQLQVPHSLTLVLRQ